jgi:hypothetical protein
MTAMLLDIFKPYHDLRIYDIPWVGFLLHAFDGTCI